MGQVASPGRAVEATPGSAAALKAAYAHCTALTAQHSRTFYLASRLLPAEKQPAIHALYAFCRVSDDTVDRARGDAAQALAAWRARLVDPAAAGDDPVVRAWTHARRRYNIPLPYANQLLDGVGRDVLQKRYETFEDLATYAYGVASTVGLMSMHIIGFRGPQAIPYAVKLGVALQLTNILRDVGQDWHAGRLYLPQEELARFGLSEADVAAGVVDARWRAFMRFQISRNRRLYAEARPGIALLDTEGRLAIAAAARLYGAILDDIERHDYDVFSRRAHTSRLRKLRELAVAWRQTRRIEGTATDDAPSEGF
jgi:phytoene synthase